ncbi:MAG: hypothetical protein M3N91_08930, partial [Pseudomonadota bacterium]|nr:hypothetical protein [Pseudomonadota bacterium]
MATALFDAIERAHRDAGDAIWPTPRVRDFAGWLREQYVQGQLANAESPRVLSEVEERELWRAVVDTADRGQDFLDPAGAGLDPECRSRRESPHGPGLLPPTARWLTVRPRVMAHERA